MTAALFVNCCLRRTTISRLLRAFSETKSPLVAWRKSQLNRLEKKFTEPLVIKSDEDLQPMWKAMESRVTKRKTLTIEEAGGRMGRSNIRSTDEEVWLEAGMYDEVDDDKRGDTKN